MATYGEGDPTDNAQEFHEWLQSDRDDLEGLNFSVSKIKLSILSGLVNEYQCLLGANLGWIFSVSSRGS